MSEPTTLDIRKRSTVRAILGTYSKADLAEYLNYGDLLDLVDDDDLLDAVNDAVSTQGIEEILTDPDNAGLLKAAGLAIEDGEIVLVRLCGGATTPEEEHALYLRAMDGTL